MEVLVGDGALESPPDLLGWVDFWGVWRQEDKKSGRTLAGHRRHVALWKAPLSLIMTLISSGRWMAKWSGRIWKV